MTHEWIVLQMAMASYRQEFLAVLEEERAPIRFLIGDRHFTPTVRSSVTSQLTERTGRNVFFLGDRVGWQSGVFRRAIRARKCVIELNPRNLTSWLVLLSRRARGRPTAAWGHAWPRAGQQAKTDRVRAVMRRLAKNVIVYTHADAEALKDAAPFLSVSVAPNSLYRERDLHPPDTEAALDSFLWIGRIVPEKKPMLALDAFSRVAPRIQGARLIMVGDGPQLQDCQQHAESLGLLDRVDFPGWVSDSSRLAPLFGRAVANISTGYVGLSVTQSLGFGCPVIFPRDEPHAPEVALLDSSNSATFTADSVTDLSERMYDAWEAVGSTSREEISSRVRSKYSAEQMARNFVAAMEAL